VFYRLCRFLSRWSAPEAGYGPLIVGVYGQGGGLAYLAIRFRAGNKIKWVRWAKRGVKPVRFDHSPLHDRRGVRCECGSGKWRLSDMDTCGGPGCLEYHMLRHDIQGRTA
jgi:hypothetical protein